MNPSPKMPPSRPRTALSSSNCTAIRWRVAPSAARRVRAGGLRCGQQKIGNVGAGDEQNHPDPAHQHPKHGANATDDVLFQREKTRGEAGLLKEFDAESGRRRESVQSGGQHPCDVGARLGEGDPGLKPGDPEVAEVAKESLVAIHLQRQDQAQIVVIEKTEILLQHADNFSSSPVYHYRFPNRGLTAEFAPPVRVGHYYSRRSAGRSSDGRSAADGRIRTSTHPHIDHARSGSEAGDVHIAVRRIGFGVNT